MVAKKDVHMPKHPELTDKNVQHKGHTISQVLGLCERSLPGDTSTSILLLRASSTPIITSTCPKIVPANLQTGRSWAEGVQSK